MPKIQNWTKLDEGDFETWLNTERVIYLVVMQLSNGTWGVLANEESIPNPYEFEHRSKSSAMEEARKFMKENKTGDLFINRGKRSRLRDQALSKIGREEYNNTDFATFMAEQINIHYDMYLYPMDRDEGWELEAHSPGNTITLHSNYQRGSHYKYDVDLMWSFSDYLDMMLNDINIEFEEFLAYAYASEIVRHSWDEFSDKLRDELQRVYDLKYPIDVIYNLALEKELERFERDAEKTQFYEAELVLNQVKDVGIK